MIELVCHLRDTEREVHAIQIDTLLATEDPFVARPDAAYWAKQRRYHGEDGPAGEFATPVWPADGWGPADAGLPANMPSSVDEFPEVIGSWLSRSTSRPAPGAPPTRCGAS
jgi:hypothetical protein